MSHDESFSSQTIQFRDVGLYDGSVVKITTSDGAEFDLFGQSVSISGSVAVVGASYHDDKGDNSGAAYIYEKDEANDKWVEVAKITASDGAEDDLSDTVFQLVDRQLSLVHPVTMITEISQVRPTFMKKMRRVKNGLKLPS